MNPGHHLEAALRRHVGVTRRGILWHYTSGDNLRAILRSGLLLPSSGVSPIGGDQREHPAVWFTRRQDWDPAAGVGTVASGEDVRRVIDACRSRGPEYVLENAREMTPKRSPRSFGGLARIGVAPETAPMSWREFLAAGGYGRPQDARVQEAWDRSLGSDPDDWRVSLEPVPASKWLVVEVRSGERKGERWEPFKPDDLAG